MKKYLLFLALYLLSLVPAVAQDAYDRYIEQYKDIAIEQMNRYGIPASITLAQGLLESGAGQSRLTRKSNNHFGIKVSGNWRGPYVRHDDDRRNEKFRKYKSARESYEDHSKFLRGGQRYAFLFRLSPTDYKGWAHGLKQAGYATNPRYAYNLIDLIERYGLYRYDGKHAGQLSRIKHEVYKCNRSYYVIAREGDTFRSLGEEMGVKARKLRKYNEVGKNHVLNEGDIVYLEEKRSRADRSLRGHRHTVGEGESLHSIAQRYGIKMSAIYYKNGLPEDYQIKLGDKLLIR